MSRVVNLPRRRPAPKPVAHHSYETVTAEERGAADALARKAEAIRRLFAASFVTGAALAHAPRLIAEAEHALAELKEMIG